MIKNLPSNFNQFAILSISEVANVLKFKTIESALSWLDDNYVTVHKFGKKNRGVYELDFYSSLLIPFSKDIIKKYPNNWENLLKEILSNDSVFSMIILKIDDNSLVKKKPKTNVKPQSTKEIELRNKLLS